MLFNFFNLIGVIVVYLAIVFIVTWGTYYICTKMQEFTFLLNLGLKEQRRKVEEDFKPWSEHKSCGGNKEDFDDEVSSIQVLEDDTCHKETKQSFCQEQQRNHCSCPKPKLFKRKVDTYVEDCNHEEEAESTKQKDKTLDKSRYTVKL